MHHVENRLRQSNRVKNRPRTAAAIQIIMTPSPSESYKRRYMLFVSSLVARVKYNSPTFDMLTKLETIKVKR